MGDISSYPSIYNIGHKAVVDIFNHPFRVQEKIDGSQFSFKRIGDMVFTRSKGQHFAPEYPPDLFKMGAQTALSLKDQLVEGWTYRGEMVGKLKQNAMTYERIPRGGVILFDIDRGDQDYLNHMELEEEANRLGLECVPSYTLETPVTMESLEALLNSKAYLGAPFIEGFVVKSLTLYGSDKKQLMAKHVAPKFREIHGKESYGASAKKMGVTHFLISRYKTEARWAKAIQHLREAGRIEDSPRDIGLLIKEIPRDIEKECKDEIMSFLYKEIWPDIARGCISGFAEWYKEQLLERQFTPQLDDQVQPDDQSLYQGVSSGCQS